MAVARKTRNRQEPLPPDMLAGRVARLRPLRAADHITSVRWRNDRDIRDNVLGYRFPITEGDGSGLGRLGLRAMPSSASSSAGATGMARGLPRKRSPWSPVMLSRRSIFTRVVAFNKRALVLYRAFGFVEEGVQRQQAFLRGRYYDVVLMGLIRSPGRRPT
jgi:hypothetical protein